MKAVVVEIKGSVAAVLSEDGRISKIKNRNYAIGQEITLKNNSKYIKMAVSAAAAIMLLVTPAWAYFTPYSYVSLDINPSFEFSINRFDRVLNVNAVNNDGEKVVEKIGTAELKNKEINDAVKNVLVELKDQGYIIEGKEGGVVVAASSKSQKKTDELAASLRSAIEEEVAFKGKEVKQGKESEETISAAAEEKTKETVEPEKSSGSEVKDEQIKSKDVEDKKEEIETDKEIEKDEEKAGEQSKKEASKEIKKTGRYPKNKFRVEVIEVRQDDVSKAKNNGVTPGKWNLVEKLQTSAKSAGHTFGDDEFKCWLDKPVQDIMKETKKYTKEEKQETKQESKEDKAYNKEDKEKYKEDYKKKEESGKEKTKKEKSYLDKEKKSNKDSDKK